MTEPRQILENTTYLVTRRCTQRQLLLLPDKAGIIEGIFLYCFAYAASKTGVLVHGYCQLANHYHAIVTDVRGTLPRFMELLNRNISKCVNDYRKRGESLWSSEHYSAVRIADEDKLWEKLVYTLKNPVKDGMVPRLAEWPGAKSDPAGYGRTRNIERPGHYFIDDGDMPDRIDLELTVPPLVGYSAEEFGEAVAAKLKAEEDEVIAEFKSYGRRFMGVKRLMAQSPFDVPDSEPGRWGTCAKDACADKHAREALEEREEEFQKAYRERWKRYQAGERDILWPPGTYWMVRHAKHRAGEPDDYIG